MDINVDRIATLIRARIPELGDQMDEITDRLQARPVMMITDEIGNRLMDVIERMSDRLDGYAAIVAGEQALSKPPTSWQ